MAVPSWAGAYFTTGFTGTTVRVKARDAVNFYASIDGRPDELGPVARTPDLR
jgi:hypothetical protein